MINYPWLAFTMYREGKLPIFRKYLALYRSFDYSQGFARFAETLQSHGDPLLEYPLERDPVIVDMGAYDGEWAELMRNRYGGTVYAFEPNPTEYAKLLARIGGAPGVHCYPYGLTSEDTEVQLAIAGAGSSVYDVCPDYAGAKTVTVALRDVARVFDELRLDRVDLLKVNIEGGEYDLLDRMIEVGLHRRCRCIRVQFHRWFDGASRRRRKIRRRLSETHDIEWDYPFVWESWLLRGSRHPDASRGPGNPRD